jgi:2-methylisocitrate lyase-like PEP mutase family enzyme
MSDQRTAPDTGIARRFWELHSSERPLLMPNPWDIGSAQLLRALGFKALATTSGGFAASLGRLDGNVTREEALAHARAIAQATGLPVSADLEKCFADEPAGVAETVRLAGAAGLAGCSVEDWSGTEIYDIGLATERVAAAAEAAHSGEAQLVLTARAENHLHGRHDPDDTIARLVAFQDAGADVLFAPRLRGIEQVRAVLQALDRPLSVLAGPEVPGLAELAEAGVSRISVGSTFAFASYGALIEAARELQGAGTYHYLEQARVGYYEGAREAFASGGAETGGASQQA